MRRDLTDFNRRLATSFGSDWNAVWDDTAGRWAIDSLSAAGHPVRQLWGWFHDEAGNPIEPNPDTGLHPYRDLDLAAQNEIIRNLQKFSVVDSGYGLLDWDRSMAAKRQYNTDLIHARRRAKANTFADMLASVDIRRPGWLKDHGNQKVRG